MKNYFLTILLLSSMFICNANETGQVSISNIFVETDLRQALRDISSQAGIQIVTDSAVQGLVSIEFIEVPLEKCLEMMLFPLGFTFKKIEDYYIVTSVDPRGSSFNLISRTERVKLNHIKAIDAVYNIPNFLLSYIKLNKNKNILTITAPEEIIKRIKEDIAVLDRKPKQVMIEVVVTELSEDAIKDIGLKWGDNLSLSVSGDYSVNPELDPVFAYQLSGKLAQEVLLSLKMMSGEGGVEIKAKPRILTSDTEEAMITIGTEKYVSLETGTTETVYTRLQSVSAGIKVKIIPFIGEDNDITLEIAIEVSDILPSESRDVKLSLNRRSAKTTVQLKDCQMIGIGGLIQENKEVRITKLPLLGNIPILGIIFRNKKEVNFKTELIIFITPTIINPENQ